MYIPPKTWYVLLDEDEFIAQSGMQEGEPTDDPDEVKVWSDWEEDDISWGGSHGGVMDDVW